MCCIEVDTMRYDGVAARFGGVAEEQHSHNSRRGLPQCGISRFTFVALAVLVATQQQYRTSAMLIEKTYSHDRCTTKSKVLFLI